MLSSPTITRQRRPARRRRSSSSCSSSAVQLSPAANFQNNQFQQKQRQLSPQGRRWRRANTTPKELAGLRFLVLSHIDELEKKLEKLGPIPDGKSVQHTTLRSLRNTDSENVTREGSPNSSSSPSAGQTRASSQDYDTGNWDSEFDFSVDDLRTWVHDSLEQLAHLRAEVTARLPDLEDLRPHFDFDFELPNLNLDEFRARLSRIEVPNFSEISSLSMTDMKTRLGDLGYEYLPTLADHLSHLNSHLTSLRVPDFPSRTLEKGNTVLKDFIDALMYSEENSPLERERVDFEVEQTAIQVRRALSDSAWGNRLLSYHQLPIKWRNNEHVLHGYRFIPLERWPSLLLSTFQLHNETANIHTHLIPAALLGPLFAYEAYASPSRLTSLPTTLFSVVLHSR
ncbi:hypothetical protein FRC15_002649 [Serendipita sp. 397]|nr:hypothetical protein FRC15_002649 [Serendipita sp. 397]